MEDVMKTGWYEVAVVQDLNTQRVMLIGGMQVIREELLQWRRGVSTESEDA